jgi:hypothetical protein
VKEIVRKILRAAKVLSVNDLKKAILMRKLKMIQEIPLCVGAVVKLVFFVYKTPAIPKNDKYNDDLSCMRL